MDILLLFAGIVSVLSLLALFIFMIKYFDKKNLEKIERGYNENEDKSKRTGEELDKQNIGYRKRPTDRGTNINKQHSEPNDTIERRTLLSDDAVIDTGEISESIGDVQNTPRKNKRGIRGIRKRRG